MTQAFDYNFNVSGDFMGKMNAMNEAVGQFSGKVGSTIDSSDVGQEGIVKLKIIIFAFK